MSTLLAQYVAAEDAWREALQAAVSKGAGASNGDWGHVQQAHTVVKQCQAALRAEAEKQWTSI
jgi:hypothetical protein